MYWQYPTLSKILLYFSQKWGFIEADSPEDAFDFHGGILVKNSQSAQMLTKETSSYFNQIKWILI